MSTTNSVPDDSVERGPEIARAIAAIQALRRELQHQIQSLIADCEAVARTEELVLNHQFSPSGTDPRDADTATTMPRDGISDSAFPSGLRRAICVSANNLPSRFTAAEVLAQLQARGFKFAGDPAGAVRDGMYALCRGKSPTFRISEAGKVGKPNLYERFDRCQGTGR